MRGGDLATAEAPDLLAPGKRAPVTRDGGAAQKACDVEGAEEARAQISGEDVRDGARSLHVHQGQRLRLDVQEAFFQICCLHVTGQRQGP